MTIPSSKPYLIRPSSPNDAEALSTLLKESFYKAFRDTPGVTEQFFENYFNSILKPENLRSVLEDGKYTFLVAQSNEGLIGMIQILHPSSNPTKPKDAKEIIKQTSTEEDLNKQVYLSRFYLLPSSQGSGLATELFNEIISICRERKYTTMKLDVLSTNHRGIRFYEKMGFKKIEEVYNQNDGKFPRIDWIMVKDL